MFNLVSAAADRVGNQTIKLFITSSYSHKADGSESTDKSILLCFIRIKQIHVLNLVAFSEVPYFFEPESSWRVAFVPVFFNIKIQSLTRRPLWAQFPHSFCLVGFFLGYFGYHGILNILVIDHSRANCKATYSRRKYSQICCL